jgi:hypothetical protein
MDIAVASEQAEPWMVVELDRMLARDPQGQALRKLRARVASGAKRCRAALDRGVPTAEAANLRKLMLAYAAALDLLPILWSRQQRKRSL